MLFNIIIGFLIPWSFGIYLFRKSPKVVILIVPIASMISGTINAFGFQLKYWDFTPIIPDDESISATPLDLGLYPVLASFMVYWMKKFPNKWLIILCTFILITTLLEWVALLFGKVSYGNGWNIFFTGISYTFAFGGVYLYYLLLRKHNIM
ncbi:CBO0543 family protein [Paenibacillus contaminans]|uniref:Uncharacterized protein n=1 Tax=Paenibacillus contaminans TaxID=450362 RepID=A0A329LQB9_9BACL|nr:CBO0543 family protein [Paenibacillus contaminans]RAV10141.1 hypothetical protein DQG23_38505 [Paenibacillus contaminans]